MAPVFGAGRRADPRPEPPQTVARVSAQRHLDARLERLSAYVAALAAAVAARPPQTRLVPLERQLAQARRALRTAEQFQLRAPGGPPTRDVRH